MIDHEAHRRIEQLAARVRGALALRAGADAFLALASLAGVAWLVPRLFDGSDPARLWLLAPLPVAVAWGLWQARRRLPRREALATWLDRRLGVEGLLVTSLHVDLAEWRGTLRERLRAAPDARPRLPVGHAAARVLPATAFLFLLAALPAASPEPAAPAHPALTQELERQELRLEELREEGVIPEPRLEELRQRLDELEARLDEPGGIHWSDSDTLEADLDRSRRVAAEALAASRDALDAYAAESHDATDAAAASLALDRLLQQLGDGPLPVLPADLARRLGLSEGAAPTASELAEALARAGVNSDELARELADALEGRLGSLAEAGLGDARMARRLAEAGRREREAAERHEHTSECNGAGCSGGGLARMPGNGGVSRGRADAELVYAGDTPESVIALDPERLPASGRTAPDWIVSGVQLVEPVADPVRPDAPGGAGADGAGEAAWQRRLAPRHREAVERFFTAPK